MTPAEKRRNKLRAIRLEALALRAALIDETKDREYIPVRLVVRAICSLADTVSRLTEVG